MKKKAVSKKTSKNLPKYQRTNEEEVRAELDAHKYRLKKTGSATKAAKMKKEHIKIKTKSIKKRKSIKTDSQKYRGSFIENRTKL